MTDFRALKKFLEPDPIEFGGITFHFRRPTVADVVKIEVSAAEDDSNFWLDRMLAGAVRSSVLGDQDEQLSMEEANAFVEAVGGIGNPIVDKSIELCGSQFDIKVRKAAVIIDELYKRIEAGELIDEEVEASKSKGEVAPPEDADSPLG